MAGLIEAAIRLSSQRVTNIHNRLAIYTLGDFRVVLPGSGEVREAAWARRQDRTLLKFLLTAPGYRSTTEQLIERFWPDVDPERGRQYLRRLLVGVRRTLEPDRSPYVASTYLVSDRESVWLPISRTEERQSSIWFDGQQFEALAEQALTGARAAEDVRQSGNAALELYRGPFLPHDVYDDWTRPTRQRFHRLWSTLIKKMAGMEVSDQRLDRAILLLGKLVEAAPDDEDAVMRLMIVNAAGGMRAEAVRIYEAFRDELASVLPGGPGSEIKSLYDTVRTAGSIDRWLARVTT